MKTLKYLYKGLLAVSVLSGAAGCTKLDVKDYSEIISDNFNPTQSDIASIIAPVYISFRPMWAAWYGNFDLQEESADAIVTPVRPNGWYDGGTYIRMHQHQWTPTEGQSETLWYNCFNGINAANRVLSQIESGDLPVSEGKEAIIAEMKVARDFCYYQLLDNFGNVPIVTDFTSDELPKQNTRKELYDFLVAELTENIPLLSDEVSSKTYGRFNQWAGYTLLAKIYLNAGVYTGTAQWQKCIEVCDKVIAGDKYILEPDYKSNFVTENENSREMIFAIPYDETKATGFIIHMKTLKPADQKVYNLQAQPWGGSCAIPQFIHTYDPDDSRLEKSWIMGPQITPEGEVAINYIDSLINIDQAGGNPFNYGFPIGKYEIKMGAKGSLSNDFPIFRYADILLMKAECLLRTGKAEEAATLVTQVRERDFKSNPGKAKVTGADLQKGSVYDYGYVKNGKITTDEGGADIKYGRFYDELGWEFAAEAHRRQDMIRFGVYSTKMWFQHKPVGVYRQLFSIPESVLNANSNLKQNPGY